MKCESTRMRTGTLAVAASFATGLVLSAPAQTSRPATTQAAQPKCEAQWWKAQVRLPRSRTLDMAVVFRPAADGAGYTATINVPAQGAQDVPLSDVVLNDEEIRFSIKMSGAVFTARRAADGRTATGYLEQMNSKLPLTLERITETEAAAVGPPRPQTPKPPFPYEQREVTYRNPRDGTTLAGTLNVPEVGGPQHPAVILITGSGPQDRDETLFGHKPFAVLAHHLTLGGIAVLRVDDRGVGGSTGSTKEATSEDFAGDVLAGVDFLRRQPDINPQRIGLVGHSEGALVAALAAAQSDRVACIVMLGGPGRPGHEILRMQLQAIARAAQLPAEQIERQAAAQGVLLDAVINNAPAEAIRDAARKLVEVQMSARPAGGVDYTPAHVEVFVDAAVESVSTRWMRSFLSRDPREALRRVRCPVLALAGTLDLQVPPEENLPEIEGALRAGGNKDVTIRRLPSHNHLFQIARTGLMREYGVVEETMSPLALDDIRDWLQQQFKLVPAAASQPAASQAAVSQPTGRP